MTIDCPKLLCSVIASSSSAGKSRNDNPAERQSNLNIVSGSVCSVGVEPLKLKRVESTALAVRGERMCLHVVMDPISLRNSSHFLILGNCASVA